MASQGDVGSFAALSRHDEYYINGGDLYFLVERVTFRVHRYFFERESPRFKGQLTIPASPGAARQGTSDSNAIVLEGVRAQDFAKFLWVFYNPKYSLYKTSADDWIVILELAHRWQFEEVKDLCVRELEKLQIPDVDRVSVYNKFGVDSNLLVPRYAALCEREPPLSLQEGLKLGMEVSIRLASAREHARANPAPPTGARSPTAAKLQEDEMRSLVRIMFDIPHLAGNLPVPPTSPIAGVKPLVPALTTTSAGKQAPQLNPPPPPKHKNGAANGAANGSGNANASTASTNGSTAANGAANGSANGSSAPDGRLGTGSGGSGSPDDKTDAEALKAAGSGSNSDPETRGQVQGKGSKGRGNGRA